MCDHELSISGPIIWPCRNSTAAVAEIGIEDPKNWIVISVRVEFPRRWDSNSSRGSSDD